ncbi:M20/M25/M40 family metallo-hydrolase [Myroides pelagicus]|uniref:M20/M25/M40 family metallo-hydrolase n=1 Tax=Myroides pelagicus TaxID=270914 RepID=A0A7K1GP14_9FLAO|nr:M20/M25/M40 family metallo-hydrolase [Myroides pelagicus]MEC4114803.1 M20/M25/M40 family metallo-hydrolase [Myroides pelagicus]MTH30586.1 M20/M25/M40 family metallo-hydrolase [Myroides pelagicus]
MKRLSLFIVFGIVVLLIVVLIKTFTYSFKPVRDLSARPAEHSIDEQAIRNLSKAIQIPTISTINYEDTNFAAFDEFISFLEQTYPAVYTAMDTTRVNKYGLIFRWKGRDQTKKPLLFLSHYDVVPISNYPENDPLTEKQPIFDLTGKAQPLAESRDTWSYAPFSGAVKDGRIYGRGTLDMKGMLISIFEAANQLVKAGYQPDQDIYLAFGHDEEVSGRQGALKIAEYFKAKNIEFHVVYDEGGVVVSPKSVLTSVDQAIALIGVAEKGFLTLQIAVKGVGGHSSMPPAKGSLVLASEIVNKLNTNQMHASLIPPIENFLDNIGSAMDFKSRLAISNKWLLSQSLIATFEKAPASNALVRTTTALTMMHASDAPNVMSSITNLTVNFRILQGDTVESVLNHVKEICKDYQVEYEVISAREPSKVSPHNSEQFRKLEQVIAKNYPNAIITPYLTLGGTDAYKYELVSDHVFRFMPVELNSFEQRSIHNEDESITIDNYMRMIDHFKTLMQQ